VTHQAVFLIGPLEKGESPTPRIGFCVSVGLTAIYQDRSSRASGVIAAEDHLGFVNPAPSGE
jgi:hypothetical protein